MRVLVTGASGFVGRFLVAALRRENADVVACGGPQDEAEYFPLDLRDPDSLRAAVTAARPDLVFHLAAQSFVPAALESPSSTYDINIVGTARLAEAVRAWAGDSSPRFIFASSAEVYGPREAHEYPLDEVLERRPINPYGASKAGAEVALLADAHSFGMDVVIARGFNQIGPGQSERFAVPSFAAQLARIAGGAEPQMYVGNLGAARDFLDVRDAVEAYLTLARRGEGAQIYNVCTGRAVTIRDVLRELILLARVPVEVREDPARVRASETPLSVGSPTKLRDASGWQAHISLRRSLEDIYEHARSHL
jgi:GDP-4-dehydro-6-deoxy-D-mannose reductase